MTAIGFPSRVLVKKGNEKHWPLQRLFFCPLERIKKAKKKRKLFLCQLWFLSRENGDTKKIKNWQKGREKMRI